MKHILFLLTFLAIVIQAADFRPMPCSRPALTADEAAIVPSADTIWPLRRATTLCLGTCEDGTIQVNVKNKHITVFNQKLVYSLTDLDGKVILQGTLGKDETLKLHTQPLPQGVYFLHVDAGGNAVHVTESKSPCFVDATALSPLQMIWGCPMLYFVTKPSPDGMLHIAAKGQEAEHAVVNIWDADGKKVCEKSTFQNNSIRNPTLYVSVPIPKEQIGRVWRIQLTPDPSPRVRFEDMALWIESGAEPGLAMSPSTLAVTSVHKVFRKNAEGSFFIGANIAKELASRPNLSVDYAFTPVPGSNSTADAATKLNDVANSCVGLTVSKGKSTFGTIRIAMKNGNDVFWKWEEDFLLSNGEFFKEVVRPEPENPAEPTPTDQVRGYQLFQREEPGFVCRHSRPAPEEIIAKLNAEASGGMVSTEFFAVRPLRDFSSMTIGVTDLHGPNGAVLPASAVTLYSVKRWPQKEAYYSTTFIDMPEMMVRCPSYRTGLEASQGWLTLSLPLHEGIPQLYAVQTAIPPNAAPGVYQGMITLNGAPALPYELTVDDFAVPEVPSMTYGLYPDTKRWKQLNYTDDEMVREMKYFRDYGITALLVYPLLTGQLNWDGQKLHVNLDEFRKQIQLYKQCGFYGVMVVDLQDAVRFVLPKLIGVKSFDDSPLCEKAFGDLLDAVREISITDQWPEFCLHTVDEPYTDERAQAALKTLKFVKEHGFKTFNTTYVDVVRKHLAPYLDYRCYCAMNYHTFPNQKVSDEIRRETVADGDGFWWYGSGCYSGVNNQQDGNIYLNRHMLGLFNWRIKATGAWSWTFHRAYGKQFDDFDDRKEDCMCYQDTKTHELIGTLQWEAVREGTYDHRYLTLWETTVAKAKASPALRERAEQSEKKVTAAIGKIPWMARDHGVSNAQLRALRRLVIAEIKALVAH